MAKATLYSAPSTHLVASGSGIFYGLLADRDPGATGGTVVLADLLDAGASPDIHAVTGAALITYPAPTVLGTDQPEPVLALTHGAG